MKNSSRSLFLFCTIVLLVFSEMPYLTVFIRFFRRFSVSLFFSVIIQIHKSTKASTLLSFMLLCYLGINRNNEITSKEFIIAIYIVHLLGGIIIFFKKFRIFIPVFLFIFIFLIAGLVSSYTRKYFGLSFREGTLISIICYLFFIAGLTLPQLKQWDS